MIVMKTLDEKKLLARMARNVGQPDLALEESIRHEEQLASKIFGKPVTMQPVALEEILTPPPSKTEAAPTLIDRAVEAIHAAPNKAPIIAEQMRDADMNGIRKSISDLQAKMGTLSWGGGGTGAVRFDALDDHQHPTDVRILEFNTAGPSYPPPSGSLSWNTDEDCLDVHQVDGTRLQVGLEQYIRVHNHSGSTLSDGTLVMFAGVEELGGIYDPIVVPFLADGTYPPLYIVGLLTDAIANGETGRATTFGKVRGVDTTGTAVSETWAVGDLLWAHPIIPGALTKVEPTVPDIVVSIAAVLSVGVDGVLLVRPTIFPQLHTGTFTSNTTQTAAVANTPYAVTFNGEGITCPHVLVANGSEIVCSFSGYFSYEFRLHLNAPRNQSGRVWIWARVGGVDVPNSSTELDMEGSGNIEARIYPSWAFVRNMEANQTFQLMWATDNTNITIHQPETVAFAPSGMSAVVRMTQVNL